MYSSFRNYSDPLSSPAGTGIRGECSVSRVAGKGGDLDVLLVIGWFCVGVGILTSPRCALL